MAEDRDNSGLSMIRRRHVLFMGGYDLQGAEAYYGLFRRACKLFRTVWPIAVDLKPLALTSEDFAHWRIDARGPDWQVTTDYEFFRQDRFVSADMADPMTRHIPRALAWIADDLVSGALTRIFRASWRFGLALLYFELVLLAWLALALAGGLAGADLAWGLLHWPSWAAAPTAVVGTLLLFGALRPLADRLRVVQVANHWPRLRRFARGEATWLDAAIEAGARRLIALAHADAADEILVIGHSGGGVLAPAVVARALELDPDIGRRSARLVLLTLGSIMPAAALHPSATRMRGVIARIAVEPSLTWIDCQSRKDVLNFWDFDPVTGTGVEVGAARCNPLIWQVRFKEGVSPEYYRRLRLSIFRLHYQFIMSGDRQAPYDYLMLVAGPVPVGEWASHSRAAAAAFAPNGSFTGYAPEDGNAAGAAAPMSTIFQR